jgi:hypothetical protein
MIAATHVPASLTVALGVAAAALILWYWRRLGAADVPESRRRIRRASLVVMLAGLPVLVWGLSFIDYRTHQAEYVVCWLLVMFLIGLILVATGLDLLNTLRLSRDERRRAILDARAAAWRAQEASRKEGGDGS